MPLGTAKMARYIGEAIVRTADRVGAGPDVTDLLAPDLTEQLR